MSLLEEGKGCISVVVSPVVLQFIEEPSMPVELLPSHGEIPDVAKTMGGLRDA